MSIIKFNYYRVEPVMKIDNDKGFEKQDSSSKKLLKKDSNCDNQNNNEKSFSNIFNEYLTKKK